MAENARQGYFNGSRPPFGFRVEKIATSAGPKNKLVIEPAEAELVREVFRQYLAGSGAKSTARNMNQRGLLYRKHLWTRDLVLRVISDPGVIGTYNWGRLDSRGKCIRPGDREKEACHRPSNGAEAREQVTACPPSSRTWPPRTRDAPLGAGC